MKASELLIEESENASFLILASDKPENHAKKGKEAGIPKIEGSGRKESEKNGRTLSLYRLLIWRYGSFLNKKLAKRQ